MRLPTVSVALLALLSLTLAVADANQRRAKQHSGHFYVPLLLRGRNAQAASGRSGDAGTGRGLMAKLTMFRSMFQQPQSNVIIIRPTAPTSLTTFTTTDLARDNANTGRRDDNDDSDADAAPTGQPLPDEADDEYEDLPPPVLLGSNGVHDKLAVERRNKHNNNSKRQQHITSYNRPVVLRKGSDNNNDSDHNRNNKHAPANNGKRRRQGNNRRKRKHKVVRAENGSNNNNNNSDDRIVNIDPNVIGISTNNNNNNNNNNGFFDLNTNARFQSIVNAFRRPQTPTVYNH